jgi:hypothetical protein
MRKLLSLTLGPALPVLLAAAVLTACGGSGSDSDSAASSDRPATAATDRSTTTTTPAPSTTAPSTTAPASTEAPTTTETTEAPAPSTTTTAPAAAPASSGRRYVCPEGGLDAVRRLQQAVDAGHQPWRLSATDVAAGCTYGMGAATVEPAGANRFRVTKTATGEQVLVTAAQPLGAGTVWAVTQITPA